jgi:hypothetical protein
MLRFLDTEITLRLGLLVENDADASKLYHIL